MPNGKVCTGFSKPYVAYYKAAGGVVSYYGGRILARGVNVNIAPDSSDSNKFYADNVEAESAAGVFTGGTATVTVDGLFVSAERMIMGLPETGGDGFTAYGDEANTPNLGFGYIARYMSGGITTYVPTLLAKVKFNQLTNAAATQQEEIDWQTQELTATIMRGEDGNHNWKYIGSEYSTELAAERALQAKLGIFITSPLVEAVDSSLSLFNTLVSDMQDGVVVSDGAITGTLKKLTSGDLVDTWGEGYFMALQFLDIDSRATSIKVGLDPSQSSGLVEIIDDPDKNGAFKVTDKDAQVFKVVTTDGTHTDIKTYTLPGLTLLDM